MSLIVTECGFYSDIINKAKYLSSSYLFSSKMKLKLVQITK